MSFQFLISAVGDISFEGRNKDLPSKDVFSHIKPIIDPSDIVVANLENPLTSSSHTQPGKCVLRGSPEWASCLKSAGITMLNLANNHLMDYGPEGLFDTICALDSAGIMHLGAGMDRDQACSPLIVTIKGRKIAFLARSSVIVASPSYAGPFTPGVAFLEEGELIASIRKCRKKADLVIVLLHWGVEEYAYPAPAQIELARQIIHAGADALIGHHPHVLQGVHRIDNGLVAYSLGNFLFDEFIWNMGKAGKDTLITLSESNCKGMILQMSWYRSGIVEISKVFTRIISGGIIVDNDPQREKEFKRLSMSLDRAFYSWWWQFYAIWREWDLRVRAIVSPSRIRKNIWKIRPRHIAELITTLKKSTNIARGKSTNPYD